MPLYSAVVNGDPVYEQYCEVAALAPDNVYGQTQRIAAHLALGKRQNLFVFGVDHQTPDGTGCRDYIHVEVLAAGDSAALSKLLIAMINDHSQLESWSAIQRFRDGLYFRESLRHGFATLSHRPLLRRFSGMLCRSKTRQKRLGLGGVTEYIQNVPSHMALVSK